VEQRRGMILRRVRGSACVGLPVGVRALNSPVGGVGTGQRACEGLERGGTSSEGANGPRARRNPTRGGDRPSNEAGSRLRGAAPLE
jgi:hypothetical protein